MPRLRGTLFHKAIGDFFTLYPKTLPDDAVEQFIALGEEIFRPFRNDPEIMSFWWTRFQRLATWIVENEVSLRGGIERAVAEVKGSLPLKVGGTDFTLSARADRIDILADGTARIVDFKSGAIPSTKKIRCRVFHPSSRWKPPCWNLARLNIWASMRRATSPT